MVAGRYTRCVVTVPAAVLAAILGVTPVLAAATWTVQPGGPVSLTSGRLTLKDTRTGAVLMCPVRMRGTLKGGSGLPGTGIGSITTASFPRCGRGLPPTPAMAATSLPWQVNFVSYNGTTGVVTGSVSHIRILLKSRVGEPCSAVIDGTSGVASNGIVTFTYTNSTARLKVLTTGGNLHFYKVRSCAGVINNGDPATISATLTVSPKQAITSP